MRIVSLVPSVTETLLAWGIEPVACTRFCEQPQLPHVGGTKDPYVGAIARLAPDLVVVDEEENRKEDADALSAAGLDVHVLAIRSLTDVNLQLATLADRLGVGRRWAGLTTAELSPPCRLRAFVPIWRRPWMALGSPTYGSSLLEGLGVANVLTDSDGPYPAVSLDEAADRRPDVVLAPSEPYPFAQRHVPELSQVAPVVLVDGKDLFWWGARTASALARLRAQLRHQAL